jgi:hypothetical protein
MRRYRRGFSYRQRFIADEVQADDLPHRPRYSVTEMTMHRVAHHFPQLLDNDFSPAETDALKIQSPALIVFLLVIVKALEPLFTQSKRQAPANERL